MATVLQFPRYHICPGCDAEVLSDARLCSGCMAEFEAQQSGVTPAAGAGKRSSAVVIPIARGASLPIARESFCDRVMRWMETRP